MNDVQIMQALTRGELTQDQAADQLFTYFESLGLERELIIRAVTRRLQQAQFAADPGDEFDVVPPPQPGPQSIQDELDISAAVAAMPTPATAATAAAGSLGLLGPDDDDPTTAYQDALAAMAGASLGENWGIDPDFARQPDVDSDFDPDFVEPITPATVADYMASFGTPQPAGTPLQESAFWGRPAFRRGLTEAGFTPGIGGGPFGAFLQTRFDPARAAFMAQSADPSLTDERERNAFARFVQQNVGRGGLGGVARTGFENLLRMLQPSTTGFTPSVRQQSFLAPTTTADYLMGEDLAREVARSQMGGFAASRLLPQSGALATQFQASPMGADPSQFLPFLNRQFGLNL